MSVDADVTSSTISSPVGVPDGIDAGLAWHYGDPFAEQRAIATSAGVIDRGNRGVLTVTGPDRLAWLHSIITQYVSDLDDGQSDGRVFRGRELTSQST